MTEEVFDHEHWGVCDKLACPRCGRYPDGTLNHEIWAEYSCAMCNQCWVTYLPDIEYLIDEEPDTEERLRL